jgi:outer membrane protein assembly factor BamB
MLPRRQVWLTTATPEGHDLSVLALDRDDGRVLFDVKVFHVARPAGRAQLISPAAKAVVSLDPLTGRELWRVRYPRPLFAHGLVYVASGRGKAELLAIRPDGQGDATDTHVAWRAIRGIGASPSPVLVGDYVYSVTDKAGVVTCLDAKTGAEVWQRRVGGVAHSASPLFADGALYFFAEDGSAVALEPGRESRELGRGALGEGGVMATPAIAGKAIFLRTESHLYRLETSAAATTAPRASRLETASPGAPRYSHRRDAQPRAEPRRVGRPRQRATSRRPWPAVRR